MESVKEEIPTITNKLVSFFLIFSSVCVFSISFIEVLFPVENIKISQARNEHLNIKAERNQSYDLLKQYIVEGDIDKQSKLYKLFEEYDRNKTNSFVAFEKLNEEKANFKFMYFKNFKYFLHEFGLQFSFLLISIILLLISIVDLDRVYLKSSLKFFSVTCMFISIFWLIWLFYYDNDLSTNFYMLAMFMVASVLTLSMYYLLNSVFSKLEKDRKIGNGLINLIIRIRNIHYPRVAKRLMKDNPDNIAIKYDVDEFDKETSKGILDVLTSK